MIGNKEHIVVTLTTWHARIANIPTVLDSILCQSVKPDAIVLNLAYDEIIPESVAGYLTDKQIIVNRVEDTKVYKKLLPALKLFPESCIIVIDDDFIYPEGMIGDFMQVHKKHPSSPISGNYIVFNHLNCHCGCASLTKKEFFGGLEELIDSETISNCKCDDIVYTYFAAKSGHYYKRTNGCYFLNMEGIPSDQSYSTSGIDNDNDSTWTYLVKRFGKVPCKNYFGYFKMVLSRRFIL